MKRASDPPKLRRIASTYLPTRWGIFRTIAFEQQTRNGVRRTNTAVALLLGDTSEAPPLVRIHSQCFTGEILGSLRCDCGAQLELAMEAISGEGCGVLIYEHQEGRGIGLMAKLQAYALQDRGLDTIEANHALGYSADSRDFSLPAAILRDLDILKVRLLSNNPQKYRALTSAGIEVIERLSCEVAPDPQMLPYLRVKKSRMGHALTML